MSTYVKKGAGFLWALEAGRTCTLCKDFAKCVAQARPPHPLFKGPARPRQLRAWYIRRFEYIFYPPTPHSERHAALLYWFKKRIFFWRSHQKKDWWRVSQDSLIPVILEEWMRAWRHLFLLACSIWFTANMHMSFTKTNQSLAKILLIQYSG